LLRFAAAFGASVRSATAPQLESPSSLLYWKQKERS